MALYKETELLEEKLSVLTTEKGLCCLMENCMAEGAATEVENMTCLLVTGEISGLLLKALWGSEGIHGMK